MLSKPTWLHNLFLTWNWDFLTLHIHIGDWLERAVDWLIDSLNLLLGDLKTLKNFTDTIYAKVKDWIDAFLLPVWQSLNKLISQVSALGSQVANWWSTMVSYVVQVVTARMGEVLTLLRDFLTFNWFSAWWGNLGTTFSAWWGWAWGKILEAIGIALTPLTKEVNRHSSILELLAGFILNPVGFIWDRFLNWFLGE